MNTKNTRPTSIKKDRRRSSSTLATHIRQKVQQISYIAYTSKPLYTLNLHSVLRYRATEFIYSSSFLSSRFVRIDVLKSCTSSYPLPYRTKYQQRHRIARYCAPLVKKKKKKFTRIKKDKLVEQAGTTRPLPVCIYELYCVFHGNQIMLMIIASLSLFLKDQRRDVP